MTQLAGRATRAWRVPWPEAALCPRISTAVAASPCPLLLCADALLSSAQFTIRFERQHSRHGCSLADAVIVLVNKQGAARQALAGLAQRSTLPRASGRVPLRILCGNGSNGSKLRHPWPQHETMKVALKNFRTNPKLYSWVMDLPEKYMN